MKKRIILVLTLIATCFVISSCTKESNLTFKEQYNAVDKQFVFKNVSGENYTDLKVTLLLEQISTGFEKEIVLDVGDFEEGDSYTYSLTEDDIKGINSEEISICIKSITRYESPVESVLIFFVFIVLFLLGAIVGIAS